MWRVWVRNSYRAKWRLINTKEFNEEWEANWYIDRKLDLGNEGEAVPQFGDENPNKSSWVIGDQLA